MINDHDINNCIKTLRDDGVILHPTDTIWGLGASILSQKGYEKIYKIKGRDRSQPLIVLVSDITMLQAYVKNIHPRIDNLLTHFDRPLTVVYSEVHGIPEYALSADKSLAIRIVKDPHCAMIIKELDVPIVSTSANISGNPFPKSFQEVSLAIRDKVDYISNHLQDEVIENDPSIIVSYDSAGDLTFLRS